MKTKITSILLIGLSLLTFSCSKSFLDDPTPQNGELTDHLIFSNKAGARSALTGIYWILRSEDLNGYGGGGSALTNRGLQTTMFHFVMKGNNILDIYDGAYWWGNESTWIEGHYNRDANGSRSPQIWDMFYAVINNANAIIQQVPELPDASDEEKNAFIAEARALRAYSYFWLARVYQKSYAINPEAPAVPIYTQSADKETYGNPRSSLKDVYQLITADIDFALAHISEHREGKYVVNKHVVSAFAAMIYQELAMQDASLWDTVIKNAQDATQGYPLMSNAEYLAGFNAIDNQEWIWGLPVPSDQSLTYYSIYSFLDQENGYYKNLYATSELFDLYSERDIRRDLLVNPGYGPEYPRYQNYTNKFRSRTPGLMEGDIVLIRSAQLLLIEAEAYIQKGEVQAGIDKIHQLQKLRDPEAEKLSGSLSRAALIDEVIKERRRELYGENGGVYFDYKRLQKTFTRTGNHSHLVTIEPDDVRWLMRIPKKEIDANPTISEADQNP